MLVSMLLFVGYMELMKLWAPKPEPGKDKPVAEELAGGDLPPDAAAEVPTGEQNTEPTTVAEADPADVEVSDAAQLPPAEQTWLTVGSLDPASGYTMLVTLNSTGGAVERIELNDPRYNNLEDATAYIGHLAWTDNPQEGGVTVNVVGAGTPAALAGIQVGDVITAIGDDAVSTAEAAGLALQKFKYGEEVPITLSRDGSAMTITVTSVRRPLEVVRPEKIETIDGEEQPNAGKLQPLSYLVGIFQLGIKKASFDQDEMEAMPSLRKGQWYSTVSDVNGEKVVEFRFPLTAGDFKKIGMNGSLDVVKRFWLEKAPSGDATNDKARDYHVRFDLDFVNKAAEHIEVGYRVDGPTGLPLEGWWYGYKTHPKKFFSSVGVRDICWRAEGEAHQLHTNGDVVKRRKDSPDSPELIIADSGKKLQYLGVDAQYFHSAILPSTIQDNANQAIVFDRVKAFALAKVNKKTTKKTPVTFRADSVVVVPENQTSTQQFDIFAGPKHPEVLAVYGLDECIVYGWFKIFAKIMGSLLHFLHSIVGNYGVSIVLLTMIVRACMFPIGRQQAKSAKMMQDLAPEMKKIKEKYAGDQEKQTKAQQDLFRKHNYNPLLGCAPALLQLPIFIGLYRALSVDIELRQTPLIQGVEWCSNLAAPDMLMQWNNMIPIERLTGYTGFLGPYLNVLPLISTGLFLVHQHLFTPPPQDEQQAMQQKMMKMMMIVMVVIFFRVPAGLCLYFITSSLWALGERLMLPKDLAKKPAEAVVDDSGKQVKQTAKPTLVEKAQKAMGRETEKESVADRKKRRKRGKSSK